MTEDSDYTLVNLTSRDLKFDTPLGVATLPRDARRAPLSVAVQRVQVDLLEVDELPVHLMESSVIPCPNMPAPEEGVLYIVPRLVAEGFPEREDLVVPDGLHTMPDGSKACLRLARIRNNR